MDMVPESIDPAFIPGGDPSDVEANSSNGPHFPVQVNFYFWLHGFLNLVAGGKLSEAKDHLIRWRDNPSLARRPYWEDSGSASDDESHASEADGDTDRCRRCLAAYATAAHMHVAKTNRNAACIVAQDVAAWKFHVDTDRDRSRCILATRTISAGEEIEVQWPTALLQTDASKLLCPQCLRCIGTPLAQWLQLPAEGRIPLPCGVDDFPVHDPSDALKGDPVPCRWHGDRCKVIFCSKECEEQAHCSHHGILCPALLTPDQQDAYTDILDLCQKRQNRHLLLAVQVSATILAEIKSLGLDVEAQALSGVIEHYVGQYYSEPWESLTDVEEVVASRLSDTRDLTVLLDRLLGPVCDLLLEAGFARELLLTPQSLSRCLGMLQLVGVQASLFSPLALALNRARKVIDDSSVDQSPESRELLTAFAAFASTRSGRQLAKPTVASAMVPFVAFCNHSCTPNLEFDFRHEIDRPGLFCSVTATRTIAAGEELNIQYVPVVATPFAERQAKLLNNWAFKCACTRCAAEAMLSESDSAWFCEGSAAFRTLDDEIDSTCSSDA